MPSIPSIVKTINYLVRDTGALITVIAKVGSAQRGQPVAILDEDIDLPEQSLPDGSVQFEVGVDSELVGRVVRVQTFVSDVNQRTNLTVVNYKIIGGVKVVTDKTQEFVEKDGGRIGHFFFINFRPYTV